MALPGLFLFQPEKLAAAHEHDDLDPGSGFDGRLFPVFPFDNVPVEFDGDAGGLEAEGLNHPEKSGSGDKCPGLSVDCCADHNSDCNPIFRGHGIPWIIIVKGVKSPSKI